MTKFEMHYVSSCDQDTPRKVNSKSGHGPVRGEQGRETRNQRWL